MRFRDKVVWITGASSGIGEALARGFAAEGATLVLSARRGGELARVAAACDSGGDVLPLQLDVTDGAAIAAAADAVLRRFGRVDILVNNAGLTQRARVADAAPEVFRRVMDVNYFGPLLLTKAVLPSMLDRRDGHIVTVTSVAGKYGSPLRSGYCGAKHAAHGFFDALREEVADSGVFVTLAVPGAVRTDVSINALTADGSRYDRMDPFLAAGMAPADCAARIIEAVHRRKREVLVATGAARRNVLLKRFSPWLLSRALRRPRARSGVPKRRPT